MSKTEIIRTGDGSHTLVEHDVGDHYHSVFGAVTESRHIFIGEGFNQLAAESNDNLAVLEIGFGTGLNAVLTLEAAREKKVKVSYVAVEPCPVEDQIIEELNYPGLLDPKHGRNDFLGIHHCSWDTWNLPDPFFRIYKIRRQYPCDLPVDGYNLVYFDAFNPEKQAWLWSAEVFSTIHGKMKEGGILVTYSAKGTVKQNLREAGFRVERVAGPPGKRHMVRAHRISNVE